MILESFEEGLVDWDNMNIFEFEKRFETQEKCIAYLKELRWVVKTRGRQDRDVLPAKSLECHRFEPAPFQTGTV